MSEQHRTMNSAYMQWAKLKQGAMYNLATSGVPSLPLSELPVNFQSLEITGSDSYGYKPLLQAIASKYQFKTENIVSTLGTSMANFLVFAALLERGDEILVEHPTYELLLSAALYFGVTIKRFHRKFEHGFNIDVSEIKRLVTPKTKLIILANLHNPTGNYTTEETLREIGAIAREHGIYVLVDEVYLDAMFEQAPQSSFHLGKEFIVTNSLTKIYGLSGLRCGWIVAQPELVKKIWFLIDLLYANQQHIAEQLSVAAFQHLPHTTEKYSSLLGRNRQIAETFLLEQDLLEIVQPSYGTVFFPKLKRGNVEQFCSVLREKYGTSVVPGSFFEMPGHFRLGVCCPTEMLQEGLLRLREALKGTT